MPATPTAPVAVDTRCRGVIRGGLSCRCGGYSRWRTVGMYEECVCGHTSYVHGTRAAKPTKR